MSWHHYRLFTAKNNEFVVPPGIRQIGIACLGRGGGCVIPEEPHGKGLGGGGGGAFAYGVMDVVPGSTLTHFGVLDKYTYYRNYLIAGAGGDSDRMLGGEGGKAIALESAGLLHHLILANGGRGGNGETNGLYNQYSHGGGGGSGSFYGRGGDGGTGHTIAVRDSWRYPATCLFGHGGGGGWGGRGGSSLVGIDAPDDSKTFWGSQSGGGGGGLRDGGSVMIPQGSQAFKMPQLATVPGGGGGAWGPGEDGAGPVINKSYTPGRGGPGLESHASDWIDHAYHFSEIQDVDLVRFVTHLSPVDDTGIPGVSTLAIYQGVNGDAKTPLNPFLAAASCELDGAGGSGAQYFHAGHGGPGGGGGGAGFIDVKVNKQFFAGMGNGGHGGFGGGGGGGVGRFVPQKTGPVINTIPIALAGNGGFGGGGGAGGVFGLNEKAGEKVTYEINGAGHGGPGGGAGGGAGGNPGGGCIVIYW
ncbi:MAG: hypothetical protein ABW104_13820 [Candidatus Thiodiazotropha sp. 6PLUC2]